MFVTSTTCRPALGEPTSSQPASSSPAVAQDERPRRVNILLAAIILLSAADLLITVANLRTVGMMEANPIESYIHSTTHSATALAMYKVITVLVCISLLYRLRHSLQSEIAAWVCVVVLAALAGYWGHYSANAHDPANLMILHQSDMQHDHWLTLAE